MTYSFPTLPRFDRSRDDTLKFNTESSWLNFGVLFASVSDLFKPGGRCINGIGFISKWINGGLLLFDCPPAVPPLPRRVFSASSKRMPRICFTWNYMKMRMMLRIDEQNVRLNWPLKQVQFSCAFCVNDVTKKKRQTKCANLIELVCMCFVQSSLKLIWKYVIKQLKN